MVSRLIEVLGALGVPGVHGERAHRGTWVIRSTGELGFLGNLGNIGALCITCAQIAITAKIEILAGFDPAVLTDRLPKSTFRFLDVRMVAEGFGVNRQKGPQCSQFLLRYLPIIRPPYLSIIYYY
jgi:hypothetical protein